MTDAVTRAVVPRKPLARLIVFRLLFLVTAILGVMTISFLIVSVTPGDPARSVAGPLATEEQIGAIRGELGLDKPIHERYVSYMGGLFRGDLGTSFYSKQPVADEILKRLPATIELVVPAVVLALVIGCTVGVIGAYFRGRRPDSAGRFVTGILQAIPDYLLGLILIVVFFFALGWAPAPSGRLNIGESLSATPTGFHLVDALLAGDAAVFGSAFSHLILPVATLALVYSAYFAKASRATVGKALQSDQVQFARALGLRELTTVRYGWVEARTVILTYSGVIFAALFGGEALVERIFAWDGLGAWALDGIVRLDVPVVQGMVLVAGTITLLTYTLVDIVAGILDPRISHA